jgi:hypothetical protein
MSKEPFTINDLPGGDWSVVWNPLYWNSGIYKRNSMVKLLDILFNDIQVDEAELAVDRGKQESILYLDRTAYYQNGEKLVDYLLDGYTVRGVRFAQLEKATAFKQHLDQLYLMKLLKADYDEENL